MPCCTRTPRASGEPTCCRGEVFRPAPVLASVRVKHSIASGRVSYSASES